MSYEEALARLEAHQRERAEIEVHALWTIWRLPSPDERTAGERYQELADRGFFGRWRWRLR